MSVFRFFVGRPVFSTLFAAAILLAGSISYLQLPVAPLPQVEFGAIQVYAALPGASPENMAATVAAPLERALGRIAGVNEMTSSSTLGATRILLQFDLGRDLDGAARDVQAAINAARRELPALPRNPTYRKASPADAPALILALSSARATPGDLYEAGSNLVAQRLLQLPGVGDVQVAGSALPAIRVSLDPDYLAQQGLSTEQVRTAIAAHTQRRPTGALESEGRRWQLALEDHAASARDYASIIVRGDERGVVRLGDLGTVQWGVQDARNEGFADDKPAVLLVVQRQSGANLLKTVDSVKALLPELRAELAADMQLSIVMDASPTVRASVARVEHALLLSVALVVLVVFIFLRSARATLIPTIVIPISLIGSFACMHLFGFSLNNLSLMALVVAVGFVVDDAIVVVENIARHVEEGMSPFAAAIQGTREVGLTVLSMSICLIAVFIPVLLMGGLPGRVSQEFAVTLAVAIAISLVVSLSVAPMLGARLLKPQAMACAARSGFWPRFHASTGAALARMSREYERSLGWALAHPRTMLLILAVMIGANFTLYAKIPKGFFPVQDTGRLFGTLQADQSSAFGAMKEKLGTFVGMIREDAAVDTVAAFIGGGKSNSASIFVSLKPRAQRNASADDVAERIRERLSKWPGATLSLQSAQDLPVGGGRSSGGSGGGGGSGARYQFALRADDSDVLREWEPKVREALAELPQLKDLSTDTQDRGLETRVLVDREAAARLGIPMRSIAGTLNDAFGQRQVAVLYQSADQYRVVMEVAPAFREAPADLDKLFVAGPGGEQIPFSAFARHVEGPVALAVNKNGGFVASTISFNVPKGGSLSRARRAIQDAMPRIGAPTALQITFQGAAHVLEVVFQRMPWLILAAILTLYAVLGILYESFRQPLTILSTLPSAGLGGLGALLLSGGEFTIVAFVGVLLLIGVVMKNAIMMVDFAIAAQRASDLPAIEAIRRGCMVRFRPILMTGLAAMAGALPLALGSGEGAELGHPLGVVIIGGLLLGQILTLYTTPIVYITVDRLRWPRLPSLRRLSWRRKRRS